MFLSPLPPGHHGLVGRGGDGYPVIVPWSGLLGILGPMSHSPTHVPALPKKDGVLSQVCGSESHLPSSGGGGRIVYSEFSPFNPGSHWGNQGPSGNFLGGSVGLRTSGVPTALWHEGWAVDPAPAPSVLCAGPLGCRSSPALWG